jgi:hypothetical protein
MFKQYPFHFIGQGLMPSKALIDFSVWFKRALTDAQKEKIEIFLENDPASVLSVFKPFRFQTKNLPFLMNEDAIDWGKQHFGFFISDTGTRSFKRALAKNPLFHPEKPEVLLKENKFYECYGLSKGSLAKDQIPAAIFCVLLEKTLLQLHAICPIDFVLNHPVGRWTGFTSWHQWSLQNSISIVNSLLKYFKQYGLSKEKQFKSGLTFPETITTALFDLLKAKLLQNFSKEAIQKIYELVLIIKGTDPSTDKELIKFISKLKIVSELDFVKTLPKATKDELLFDQKGHEDWEAGRPYGYSADNIRLKPETIAWLKNHSKT